jgi:hypothetical protein
MPVPAVLAIHAKRPVVRMSLLVFMMVVEFLEE